jgi:hypothetical protein
MEYKGSCHIHDDFNPRCEDCGILLKDAYESLATGVQLLESQIVGLKDISRWNQHTVDMAIATLRTVGRS